MERDNRTVESASLKDMHDAPQAYIT